MPGDSLRERRVPTGEASAPIFGNFEPFLFIIKRKKCTKNRKEQQKNAPKQQQNY